jgi:hypothetical protein
MSMGVTNKRKLFLNIKRKKLGELNLVKNVISHNTLNNFIEKEFYFDQPS